MNPTCWYLPNPLSSGSDAPRSLMSHTPSPTLSTPFLEDDDSAEKQDVLITSDRSFARSRAPILSIVSLAFNVIFASCIIYVSKQQSSMVEWRGERPVYSPIENAVRHEEFVFHGLTERSKYHGPPSDELDARWEALYEHGISVVPGSIASHLTNKTDLYVGLENHTDPHHHHGVDDRHIVSLDVFHILHCVNTLRQMAWPDRYPQVMEQRYRNISGVPFDHIDHCINAIRESLMCSADITPNVWYWNEQAQVAQVQFGNLHTCADFEGISAWARGVQAPVKFSDASHTHGELVPAYPRL